MKNENKKNYELKRNLTNRHIQLISIGGAIGSGLFMGSGKAISLAGPSILLVYMIIGFFLFFVMRALGELLLSNLEYDTFSDFASKIIGPWAGFFTGWTYWFCWVITATADIIVISGIYVNFWFPHLPTWISSLIFISIFCSLNLLAVKMFGETEFWFSMIKIVTIIILIIVGFSMAIIHFQSQNGTIASFNNIWNNGDLLPNGLHGFFSGFQLAIFSFVGIELVGTTSSETKDPYKSIPKAINAIPIRIVYFYILSLCAILCVSSWQEISADKSPFVEVFLMIGLPSAAGIINFVVLTSAASSANSGIYSTSRMLYNLSKNSNGPKIFTNLSKKYIPANALIFSCICLILAVLILYINPNIILAFQVITSLSAILFIFIWAIITISYLIYRKKYPALHSNSKYKMPFSKIMPTLILIFFAFILVLLSLEKETRLAIIISPIWFLLLYIFWKLKYKKAN